MTVAASPAKFDRAVGWEERKIADLERRGLVHTVAPGAGRPCWEVLPIGPAGARALLDELDWLPDVVDGAVRRAEELGLGG